MVVRHTNGAWTIEVILSKYVGHLTGWLIDNKTGKKYVFSVRDGKVTYTKPLEVKRRGIPTYIDDFLLNGAKECL